MADASLVPVWAFSVIDENGDPISGAKLYTYVKDSVDTALATYQDSSLTIAHANPIVADSAGRFPNPVYAQSAQYKFVLKDANDNTLQTIPAWQPVSLFSNQTVYASETGAADAYVVDPDPAVAALTNGLRVAFFAANANTTASTLAVSGLTATAIQKNGSALTGGEIGAGDLVEVTYNGTAFQLSNNPRFNIFSVLQVIGALSAGSATITGLAQAGDLTLTADNPEILGGDTDGALYISSGTTTALGAGFILYGDTHATKAGDWELVVSGTVVLQYDSSANTFDFKSKKITTTNDISTTTTVLVGSGATDQGDGCVDITGDYSISGVPIQSIRGWVSFDPSATLTVLDSFNVSSVTDNGTGEYTVNWNTNFANNDYAAIAICQRDTATVVDTLNAAIGGSTGYTQTVGTCKFVFETLSSAAQDPKQVNVIALGDQ